MLSDSRRRMRSRADRCGLAVGVRIGSVGPSVAAAGPAQRRVLRRAGNRRAPVQHIHGLGVAGAAARGRSAAGSGSSARHSRTPSAAARPPSHDQNTPTRSTTSRTARAAPETIVNGVKTIMVNGLLRRPRRVRQCHQRMVKDRQGIGGCRPVLLERTHAKFEIRRWPSPGPLPPMRPSQSALRTLEAGSERHCRDRDRAARPAGARLRRAVELIRKASGRVIVTGLGKSGHVARKIAATLASTGTPAFFVHAAEASHGDLGMITTGRRHRRAVVVRRAAGDEEPGQLFHALRDPADRDDLERGLLARPAARIVLELPKAREACPHNLAPTTSTLMQAALGDALAIALLEEPRLHRAGIRQFPSRRQARRDAQAHQRPDALGRRRAGQSRSARRCPTRWSR